MMSRLLSRKIARCGLVLAACMALGPIAAATSLITVTGTNTSSAPESTFGGQVSRSFQSSLAIGALQQTGLNELTFGTRFAWQNSIRVESGGATVALTNPQNSSYTLNFTINDPLNFGYTVNVDTLMRGYVTAKWGSGDNLNGVAASSGSLSGRIDTDTTDANDTLVTFSNQVSDLTLLGGSTSANLNNTFSNELIDKSDSYAAGSFSGTRSFALRFTTFGSSNNVFMQNNMTGEAGTRFGMNPVDPDGGSGFDIAFTPGLDQTPLDQLGHFVTVTTTFNEDPSVIPTPGAFSGGMALFAVTALLRRKKTA
jgi:hypothetical protein